jgi:hypothetical protein
MKRLLLLLASGLLAASTAQAQIGLRVGGTWMEFSKPLTQRVGAASVKTSSQLGYLVGVSYQVPLGKRFSLVPEAQFSHERQQVNVDSNGSPSIGSQSDYHLRLSYFNVPVLAQLSLGPVYLEAGPQVSLLVGGRGEGITNGYSTTSTYSTAIDQRATDRYKRFDAGLCLGVGAKLPAGLGVSLRAYQSLVQLSRSYSYDAAGIPYTATEEYRQTLQASLTYRLSKRQ